MQPEPILQVGHGPKTGHSLSYGRAAALRPPLDARLLVAGGSTYGAVRRQVRASRIKPSIKWLAFFTAVVWTATVVLLGELVLAP